MPNDTPLAPMGDLRAQLAAAGMMMPPMPVRPPAMPTTQGLNEAQVLALIDKALVERVAASPANKAFESVFAKALTPADFQAFQQYVAAGSPGFAAMLEGGKFDPLAQLLWETIKENTK